MAFRLLTDSFLSCSENVKVWPGAFGVRLTSPTTLCASCGGGDGGGGAGGGAISSACATASIKLTG